MTFHLGIILIKHKHLKQRFMSLAWTLLKFKIIFKILQDFYSSQNYIRTLFKILVILIAKLGLIGLWRNIAFGYINKFKKLLYNLLWNNMYNDRKSKYHMPNKCRNSDFFFTIMYPQIWWGIFCWPHSPLYFSGE
jgi:hypothetical protein